MEGTTKGYNTRRKRKLHEFTPRIDWKRTKVDNLSRVFDSDEFSTPEEETDEDDVDSDEFSTPEEETDEEKESEKCAPSADSGEDDNRSIGEREEKESENSVPFTCGKENDDRIKKPRRKSTSGVLHSSDSSDSGSDVGTIVRKVNTNSHRCVIDDEDDQEAGADKVKNLLNNFTALKGSTETSEETKTTSKKQKRLANLQQLAEKRRSRCRTSSQEPLVEKENLSDMSPTAEALSESEESDDMADFIEPDDEEHSDKEARCQELFVKHNLSQFACRDLYSHLQKVIKALLINKVDNDFLITLYEGIREKRYAKDLLKSLNYLDERIIEPRLEKLTTSCRWCTSYKERVNCYPHLFIQYVGSVEQFCDACKLRRTCSYKVTLSGLAYDKKTLQIDDFLPNDKQVLFVGAVCADRSKAYHQLRHYKYSLSLRCAPFLDVTEDIPAKEIVNQALSNMEEEDFINKEVECLEEYLNKADYFQEEVLIN